jgi:uncharacterized membrane protein YfhO
VGDPAQSLERVAHRGFDFRTSVVLEERPDGWTETSGTIREPASVRFLSYEPNRVLLQAETSIDGLLVLTDTASPGWKARLDGQSTRVYVANHAFRAVVVPAGTHRVEFAYQPAAFWLGAAVSLLTLVAAVICVVLPWSRQTEKSGQ